MTLIVGSPEWLEARRPIITASRAKAILQVDPFMTPLEVWQDMKGLLPPKKDSADMRRGRLAEDYIAQLYSIRTGNEVIAADFKISEKYPWLGATPDRLVVGKSLGLECKSRRYSMKKQYGEDGTSFARQDDVVQSLVNGVVFEATEGWNCAVLFGNEEDDFRVYRIERDKQAETTILDFLHDWYQKHYVGDVPPEAVDVSDMSNYLKNRYQQHTDTKIAATPEIEMAIQELLSVKKSAKDLEVQETALKNVIQAFMQDNAECIGTSYQATWKKSKDTIGVDWEAVANELGATQELIEKHKIITRTGSRTFLPKSLIKEIKQ